MLRRSSATGVSGEREGILIQGTQGIRSLTVVPVGAPTP
jgi:hypothetical protein